MARYISLSDLARDKDCPMGSSRLRVLINQGDQHGLDKLVKRRKNQYVIVRKDFYEWLPGYLAKVKVSYQNGVRKVKKKREIAARIQTLSKIESPFKRLVKLVRILIGIDKPTPISHRKKLESLPETSQG